MCFGYCSWNVGINCKNCGDMNHAIETLEAELNRLNTANIDEEDDLIGAVICMRNTADIKLSLKILKEFIENSKILKF